MTDLAMRVLKGTLEFLAMRTLAGGQRLHGFEIRDSIHVSTDRELHVEEGALYPALHRLEKRGWLDSQWGVSEKGRRAKYYGLTSKGQRALAAEELSWARYVAAVALVAGPKG